MPGETPEEYKPLPKSEKAGIPVPEKDETGKKIAKSI